MIRKAIINDAPRIYELLTQIAKLHADLYPEYFGNTQSKYDIDGVKELIEDASKEMFVYEDEDTVYGYILGWFIGDSRFFIDDLCVDENARGKQVGQKLLHHIETRGDIEEVQLNVWLLNSGAVRFYEKQGYDVLKYVMRKRTGL